LKAVRINGGSVVISAEVGGGWWCEFSYGGERWEHWCRTLVEARSTAHRCFRPRPHH